MQLVLLHALPLDERMWDSTRSRFPDACVPTLYRLGASVADWAVAVLAQCHDDELMVVGNSVGGSVALEMACAAPDQVRGVVLIGARPGVRRDPQARDAAVRLLQEVGMCAAWDRYWAPLFGAQARSKVVARAKEIALSRTVDDLINGVQAFYDRRDQSHFVKTWAGQLVVVSGAQDQTPTPAAAADGVAGTSAQQVVVSDSGHYVPLEQPNVFQGVLERQWQALQA